MWENARLCYRNFNGFTRPSNAIPIKDLGTEKQIFSVCICSYRNPTVRRREHLSVLFLRDCLFGSLCNMRSS